MNNNSINVNISLGTIIKSTLFIVLLLLIYFFQNLVLSILTAIVLASSFEPLISKIERIRIHRVFATIIVYIGFLLTIVGIIFIFVPQITAQFSDIYTQLPNHINTLNS